MSVRRDRGPSIILAALRGFCLFIFMATVGLPACRQAGRQKKPLGTSVPPLSRGLRLKFVNNLG
jgi:hypothetical protein